MDEQLRWLGGIAEADLIQAQQANPPALKAEATERTRRLGSEFNVPTRQAAPDGALSDARPYGTSLPPPTASAPVSWVSCRHRRNTVPLAHVKDFGGVGEDQAAPELLQSFSRSGVGFFAIINVWHPRPLGLLPHLRGRVGQYQDRRRPSGPGQPAAGGRAPPPAGRQRPVSCRSCQLKAARPFVMALHPRMQHPTLDRKIQ
jgi:hypothetical protein